MGEHERVLRRRIADSEVQFARNRSVILVPVVHREREGFRKDSRSQGGKPRDRRSRRRGCHGGERDGFGGIALRIGRIGHVRLNDGISGSFRRSYGRNGFRIDGVSELVLQLDQIVIESTRVFRFSRSAREGHGGREARRFVRIDRPAFSGECHGISRFVPEYDVRKGGRSYLREILDHGKRSARRAVQASDQALGYRSGSARIRQASGRNGKGRGTARRRGVRYADDDVAAGFRFHAGRESRTSVER